MDKHMLDMFRKRLLSEKEQLMHRITFINESGLATSMSDSLGELSLYDNNPADIGSELFERSKDFALRDDAKLRIVTIDEALSKIEKGTYGTCDICGGFISFQRLQAVPETAFCYRCSHKQEEKPAPSVRPVEEDVMEEIYQQSFDDVEYDLEDAWQDVARYTEHAGQSGAGAYYGDNELAEEDRGYVEEVDNLPADIAGKPLE